MMKSLVVVWLLVAACHATGAPSATADSFVTAGSSFSSSGTALSEAVGPDGSKQGECAYSDSTGQQTRVRYVLRPGVDPEFVLVEGDKGQDPAQAYKTCVEAYRQSQLNAQSSFSMGIRPFVFNPYVNPFVFNPFAFNPFDFNPFLRNEGKSTEAAGEPVRDAVASRVNSVVSQMEAQNRVLHHRNQQLEANLRRLEQQNIDMQRRLMHNLGV